MGISWLRNVDEKAGNDDIDDQEAARASTNARNASTGVTVNMAFIPKRRCQSWSFLTIMDVLSVDAMDKQAI